jgi:hypothetical protein
MNGKLEAEVYQKQLEVASLQALNLRHILHAKGIDHSQVPVFQPSDWEVMNGYLDSSSDRKLFVFFLRVSGT